ncbi:MAG: heme exporter protein CcmD [Alphaproteobacteria bacterium]|nr:heme exporter protein CcmD [Alphaproteobacteria bacterium]
MGGYAAYVWPAFGVTAVVMIGLVVGSVRALRRDERALAALDPRRTRRMDEAASGGEP